MAAEASGAERLRLMCSHGGRFLPCGPDGAIQYVGGETRVIVVPREVSFRELAAKLGELDGRKIVSAARYRLADDDDGVLVTVTCDEELAHMRDEYDRLKGTRPSASFRVFFVSTNLDHAASGWLGAAAISAAESPGERLCNRVMRRTCMAHVSRRVAVGEWSSVLLHVRELLLPYACKLGYKEPVKPQRKVRWCGAEYQR